MNQSYVADKADESIASMNQSYAADKEEEKMPHIREPVVDLE